MSKAPQLKVVRELNREDVIHHLSNGYKSLSDLERRSGIDRKILEGLQEEIDPKRQKRRLRMPSRKNLDLFQPPDEIAPAASSDAPRPIVGRTYSQIFWGIVAAWIGLVLGASGIIVNCQYWYAAGGTNLTVSLIFCAMGGTADVITIAIPSWAAELRKRKNYGLCGIVFIVFILAAPVSIIASGGFSGTHIGDTAKARGDAGASKERYGKELNQKVVEHDAILKEIPDLPEVIEIQIQNERGRIPRDNLRWSRDCTDTTYSDSACRFLKQLRVNKAKAERRLKLEAEIKEQTPIYEAMPSISSKDPAAEHASQITFGYVSPEAFENYLINALAVAPILSGLFFMVMTALLR